jgi:hypothetical protein
MNSVYRILCDPLGVCLLLFAWYGNNFSESNRIPIEVYKMAFDVAMKIFELSKKFPVEESYSLTDQIRRSSRSVCAFFS